MEKGVVEEAKQDQAPRSPSRVVLTITILAHRLITNPDTPLTTSNPLLPLTTSSPPCHHFLCPSHFQASPSPPLQLENST